MDGPEYFINNRHDWTGLSHSITSSDLLGQLTSENSTAFMRLDVEETSTTNYNLKLEGDDTGGGNTAITATETVGILLMNKASLSLPEALANGNASWSSATLDSNEYMAVAAPSQIAWTTAAGDLSPTLYDCAVHASSVQPQIQLQATTGSSLHPGIWAAPRLYDFIFLGTIKWLPGTRDHR